MRHSEAIDKYLAPLLWRKAVKSSPVKYLAPLLGRIGKARQGKARQGKARQVLGAIALSEGRQAGRAGRAP